LIPVSYPSKSRAANAFNCLDYVNRHLIAKFPAVMAPFHDNVIPSENRIRNAAIRFLREYVETHKSDFMKEELSALLIGGLRQLVERMVDSCLFVNMIGAFMELYEGAEVPIAKLMELLLLLSSECEHLEKNQKPERELVQQCLCIQRALLQAVGEAKSSRGYSSLPQKYTRIVSHTWKTGIGVERSG
jgi:hypothetical protein